MSEPFNIQEHLARARAKAAEARRARKEGAPFGLTEKASPACSLRPAARIGEEEAASLQRKEGTND